MASRSDADKAAARSHKSATKAPASTSLQKVLVYLILVGMGAIGGYVIFYSIFNHRCADLLDEAEGRHNVTLNDWQNRYAQAMDDHNECLEDENLELELSELRGRAKDYMDLTSKHQTLLEKYEANMEQLAAARVDMEQTESKLKEMASSGANAEDIKQWKEQVAALTVQRDDLSDRLEQKTFDQQRIIQNEVNRLKAENQRHSQDNQSMRSFIQKQQRDLLHQFYGKGPYQVQFALGVGGREEPSLLTVDMASPQDMPHSIHNFFKLIDRRVYHGVPLASEAPFRMVAGTGDSTVKDRAIDVGFENGRPNSFFEPSVCPKYSMGFLGPGPELKFQLYNEDNRDPGNRGGCFGKVTKGIDTLVGIMDALGGGASVEILDLKLLPQDAAASEL